MDAKYLSLLGGIALFAAPSLASAQTTVTVQAQTQAYPPPPPNGQPMYVQPGYAQPGYAQPRVVYVGRRTEPYEGGPIPPNAHVESRVRTGWIAAGLGVFLPFYVISFIVAQECDSSHSCRDG